MLLMVEIQNEYCEERESMALSLCAALSVCRLRETRNSTTRAFWMKHFHIPLYVSRAGTHCVKLKWSKSLNVEQKSFVRKNISNGFYYIYWWWVLLSWMLHQCKFYCWFDHLAHKVLHRIFKILSLVWHHNRHLSYCQLVLLARCQIAITPTRM